MTEEAEAATLVAVATRAEIAVMAAAVAMVVVEVLLVTTIAGDAKQQSQDLALDNTENEYNYVVNNTMT